MDEKPPQVEVSSDDRMWAVLSHLAQFVFPIFGPLVIWLVKKEDSAFIGEQAKEALNFQLAVTIVCAVSAATCFLSPLAIVAVVVVSVLAILAAVEANKGVWYRYPYTIRMIS